MSSVLKPTLSFAVVVPAGPRRLQGAVLFGEARPQRRLTSSGSSASLNSRCLRQKRRSTTKVRSSPDVKVRVTAKAKAAGSRAATQTVGVAKRVMAYRAKVAAARTARFPAGAQASKLTEISVFFDVVWCAWPSIPSVWTVRLCLSPSSSRTCPTRMRRRRRASRLTLTRTRRQDPPTARTTTRR